MDPIANAVFAALVALVAAAWDDGKTECVVEPTPNPYIVTLTCTDPATGQWNIHAVGAGQAATVAEGLTT